MSKEMLKSAAVELMRNRDTSNQFLPKDLDRSNLRATFRNSLNIYSGFDSIDE